LTEFKINCNTETESGKALRKIRGFGCGNYSVVGAVKGKPGVFGHMSLFCQSYRCDRCRKPKLRKVRARIAEIAQEHNLTRMATLTLDAKKLTAKEQKYTDRYIRECWRKMRISLARQYSGSLAFVGVLEFQKNGNAHLHILLGRYIPREWLSTAWQANGGGKEVDIQFVDVHRVSAYLSVYLVGDKVAHTWSCFRSVRGFHHGALYSAMAEKRKRGWWMRRESIDALYDAAANPVNERWIAVDDLRPFALEMLGSFESPPSH